MEGDPSLAAFRHECVISIHSLRVEGDNVAVFVQAKQLYFNPLPPRGGRLIRILAAFIANNFNPLPPRGGRPLGECSPHFHISISIHSLRVEGDGVLFGQTLPSRYFNPLPPRGGRRPQKFSRGAETNFNPLPPRGGRRCRSRFPFGSWNFNPLPPRGGRHYAIGIRLFFVLFQSTPSAWRETS